MASSARSALLASAAAAGGTAAVPVVPSEGDEHLDDELKDFATASEIAVGGSASEPCNFVCDAFMMADTLGELQSILNANPPKGFAELGRYAHELIEFVVFKDPEGAVFRVSRGPADRIASMHSCSLASKGAMQARNLIKVREAVGLKNLGLQVPPDPIRLGVALQPLPPLSAADVQSGALASLQSPFSSRHQIWRLVGIVSNRTVLTVERAVEEQGGEGVDASEVAEDPNPPLVRLTGLPLPTTNETLSSELEQVNMPLKSIESLTKEKKKKMALVRFMYRQHAEEAVRNWLSLFGGEDVRANWVDG